jgi:hypothetical protein
MLTQIFRKPAQSRCVSLLSLGRTVHGQIECLLRLSEAQGTSLEACKWKFVV